MQLKDIGQIGTGIVLARKKAKRSVDIVKEYQCITIKSLDSNGTLNHKELDLFKSNEVLGSKYLTKKGDIIIRLTTPFTTISISENDEGFVIPSNFAFIRLNNSEFQSEYIAMFLNSDICKKQFSQMSMGVTIPMIKTSELGEVTIKKLDTKSQINLVELNNCYLKEKELLLKLVKEKEKLTKQAINNKLK